MEDQTKPAIDLLHDTPLVRARRSPTPITPGHCLVEPKRPVATFWETTPTERAALFEALDHTRAYILRHHQADGFNIGWSDDQAAGQTSPTFQIHIIPLLRGDGLEDRRDITQLLKGINRSTPTSPVQLNLSLPHPDGLIHGEDDPLLDHLAACFPLATRVDIAVAFIMNRGYDLLRPYLIELLERNKQLRLITGDYFGVTDPIALERLLDLDHDRDVRVFETKGQAFHPKSYIFHFEQGQGIAFVGSSNLSESALGNGVEWNYRVLSSGDGAGFESVASGFESLFAHEKSLPLNHDWITDYRKRRDPKTAELVGVPVEVTEPAKPHDIQKEALAELETARASGYEAGLVVLATGLGKTWLSAFDSCGFERVLFVAHVEEILDQALATFRRIRPDAKLGKYTGGEKTPEADVLFASIQTISKEKHLYQFASDHFDYIVIDEFHHAAAKTYRRLIEHFQPRFLLGLTATPERTDGADILSLCGHKKVYNCDLGRGIQEGLLCPFHYFGVPDEVDYAQIPWRSTKFDEKELTNALATKRRAENAFEQFELRGGKKALGFCCSQRHARFMADFFASRGKRAVAVYTGPDSAPRANSLEALAKGELDIIFCVNIFNEGLDLPSIDTVLMLRPTESKILWLQQFGRGLRVDKESGKDHLRVIDYIGNHRTFLNKPQALLSSVLGIGDGHEVLRQQLGRIRSGDCELPPGCEITYDLEALEILSKLLPKRTAVEDLKATYEEFRMRFGRRPTASELFRSGALKRGTLKKEFGSWFEFVEAQGDLNGSEETVLRQHAGYLRSTEQTPTTKCFKLLVIQSLLELDRLPGTCSIEELEARFDRIAKRNEKLHHEVELSVETHGGSLKSMLKQNPLRALSGTKRGGASEFYQLEDSLFSTRFTVSDSDREAFTEMVRELVEWRLEEHLAEDTEEKFECKVWRNDRHPILKLPDRSQHTTLPSGPTPLVADGRLLEAEFVKIAINVARDPQNSEQRNVLPEILRGWFGEQAGASGTDDRVVMERAEGGYRMSPKRVSIGSNVLQIGHAYMREELPPFFDREFNTSHWRQGFLSIPGNLILLVTLDKGNMAEQHKYHDQFLSANEFQWQSQNRTNQDGTHGRLIREHAALGLDVQLFVRKKGKRGQKAAPFIYCGLSEFERWEGEKPITIWWRLLTPLSASVLEAFTET